MYLFIQNLVPIGVELREGGILVKSQSTGYAGNVIE